jgi:hypothetical protein
VRLIIEYKPSEDISEFCHEKNPELAISLVDKAKWDNFWYVYFKKEWCSSVIKTASWNIYGKDGEYLDIINRTNNGLERYNRHLKTLFPSPHPPLQSFVQRLEEESRDQVKRKLILFDVFISYHYF